MDRKSTRIVAPKVIYDDGGNQPAWLVTLISFGKVIFEWSRAFVVISVLAIVSASVGIYTYRIITLPGLTFEKAMVAVFRSAPPRSEVIWLALVCGLIFLLINIRYVFNKEITEKTSGGTRFFAGTVLAVWVDVYWLNISPFRVWLGIEDILTSQNAEIIMAQIVTAILTLVLLSISTQMVHVSIKNVNLNMKPMWASLLNWLRFIVVMVMIGVCIVVLTGTRVPTNLLDIAPKNILPFSISWIGLNVFKESVVLMMLLVASIFYWPPKFKNMRSFGLLRILIILFAVVACGWTFQQLPNINGYVDILFISALFAFSGIPVQRALG